MNQYLIYAVIALASASGSYLWTSDHYDLKIAKIHKAQRDATDKIKADAQSKSDKLQGDIDALNTDWLKQVAIAKADAANANAASDRLHKRLTNILTQYTSSDTGITSRGAATGDTPRMLANLLEEFVRRNKEVGRYADGTREALAQCIIAYDNARASVNNP